MTKEALEILILLKRWMKLSSRTSTTMSNGTIYSISEETGVSVV
jgi:hypothetical protein